MDYYLCSDTKHNLSSKYRIHNTFAHRARVVYTHQPELKQEKPHISRHHLDAASPKGPKQTPPEDQP